MFASDQVEAEVRRFFSLAQEGAQVRAVATWVRDGSLDSLAGFSPRALVIVAVDRLTRAAVDMVLSLNPAIPFPACVVDTVPSFIGPLDIVVIAGECLDIERIQQAAERAVQVGAATVVIAAADLPLPDEVLRPEEIPFGADYSVAKIAATLAAVLSGPGEHTAVMVEQLARELDDEIAAVHPERGIEINAARQLAELYTRGPIAHAGMPPLTRLLAEQWLHSGWVSAVVPAQLSVDTAAAPDVAWTTIGWDGSAGRGIEQTVDSDGASDLARALRYYIRAAAAPVMEVEQWTD